MKAPRRHVNCSPKTERHQSAIDKLCAHEPHTRTVIASGRRSVTPLSTARGSQGRNHSAPFPVAAVGRAMTDNQRHTDRIIATAAPHRGTEVQQMASFRRYSSSNGGSCPNLPGLGNQSRMGELGFGYNVRFLEIADSITTTTKCTSSWYSTRKYARSFVMTISRYVTSNYAYKKDAATAPSAACSSPAVGILKIRHCVLATRTNT